MKKKEFLKRVPVHETIIIFHCDGKVRPVFYAHQPCLFTRAEELPKQGPCTPKVKGRRSGSVFLNTTLAPSQNPYRWGLIVSLGVCSLTTHYYSTMPPFKENFAFLIAQGRNV